MHFVLSVSGFLLQIFSLFSPCASQYSGGMQAFAELLATTENKSFTVPVDEFGDCPLVGDMVSLVPYNGSCAALLSFKICEAESDAHWLVLNKETGKAECKLQTCHNGAFRVNGKCVLLERMASPACPETKELTQNVYGEGVCDCPYTHVYHPETDRCFVPYTRGPCEKGYSLQKLDMGEDVLNPFACQRDICEREGAVPITESGRHVRPSGRGRYETYKCYSHWRDWPGPCPPRLSLQLNLVTKEVGCDLMDMGYVYKDYKYRYRPCTTGAFSGSRCLKRPPPRRKRKRNKNKRRGKRSYKV